MNKVYAILLWFALLFCHNGLLANVVLNDL